MTYYNFGEVFKRLRKTKGLTQEQVAESLGYAASTISKIESGKQAPSFASLEAAMQMLGEDSQDYFRFIITGDEQFGYENLINLRHLAVEGRLTELRELATELDGKKPFDEHFFSQFLQYCKIISAQEMSEEVKLELLLETIRITKKDFDIGKIRDYLLTYNEITIINKIAEVYFNLGEKEKEKEKAVQILYGVKDSMDANYANDWEKSRTYPALMYNLSTMLGLSERHDEAYEACHTAMQWAIKFNKMRVLPSILANLAHCLFIKGDMSGVRERIHQAYFSARGMEQFRLATLIRDIAKREYNIEII